MLDVDVNVLGVTVIANKVAASKHIAELINPAAELLEVNLSVSTEEVSVFDEYIRGVMGF